MAKLMSIQNTVRAMQPIQKQIAAPPVLSANIWGTEEPILSNSQKAQAIMESNGLDGMEFGDDPRKQRMDRCSVYEIIMSLLDEKWSYWSYDRINDWCRYAKKMCTFTLNGEIVR